jgi:hypothetical protein
VRCSELIAASSDMPRRTLKADCRAEMRPGRAFRVAPPRQYRNWNSRSPRQKIVPDHASADVVKIGGGRGMSFANQGK